MQQQEQQQQVTAQQQVLPHHHQQQQQQQQHGLDQFQQQHQQQQQQGSYAGILHQRRAGDKVHFCICCQTPIAIYGRLLPCLHAFCLTCASDMPKCFICLADINRMERVVHPLFISAATLQSFTSEDLLARHTAQLYLHLKRDPAFAVQQQQQPPAIAVQAGAAAAAAGAGWAGNRQQ